MRKIGVIIMAALIIAACVNGVALAQLADTYWIGGTSTNWFYDGNWDNNTPNSSKHAIIPATTQSGRMPEIRDTSTTARAGKLTIQKSGNDFGTLFIDGGCVLELGDGNARTSTLDGDVTISRDHHGPGTLKVRGDHTIEGDGGTIILDKDSLIDEYTDNGNDKLTLKSTGSCGDPTCSIVLTGIGRVGVALDNRAYVVADNSGQITLEDRDKTGTSSGSWIVKGGATLKVSCHVTGACNWFSEDDNYPGKIELTANEGCVRGAGDLTLTAGSLTCFANTQFCTTGKLTWKSVANSSGTTSPKIFTTSTSSATFGLGGASTCPSCP